MKAFHLHWLLIDFSLAASADSWYLGGQLDTTIWMSELLLMSIRGYSGRPANW
jgi:hypothetical protein